MSTQIDRPAAPRGVLPQTERAAVRTTLDRLPFGVRARVRSIDGRHRAARRLIEMGVVPGAEVSVLRAAPLGDPLQVDVRGCRLALRRAEAAAIGVEEQSI